MLGPSDYFRELTHVVHAISRDGKAVIVGRGVHLLLDPATLLRVRVVAPIEVRARGLMERRRIDERAARVAIEEADRDRRDFIRDHYNQDIDDPTGYDLWLNLGSLTLEGAAETVVSAFRSRFSDGAQATAAL
jgi:cytidylate kinase